MRGIPYGPQENFSVFEDTMVEMNWQEVQAAADRGAVVLLPVGIVEAHGPHMDLSADFYLSALSCRFLRQELSDLGVESLIAPPVYWGIARDTAKYAGTFSVHPDTMRALLGDILSSLAGWGFRYVFVQNAHGDHTHLEAIRSAVTEANALPGFKAYFMWELDIDAVPPIPFPEMREDRYQPDYHAGAIETAQMAAFFPHKVRCEVAKSLPPQPQFDPLAYCGDPASYDLERNMVEYARADAMLDARKVRAILERDQAV